MRNNNQYLTPIYKTFKVLHMSLWSFDIGVIYSEFSIVIFLILQVTLSALDIGIPNKEGKTKRFNHHCIGGNQIFNPRMFHYILSYLFFVLFIISSSFIVFLYK